MSDREVPIVVVKKVRKGGGHHGGSWKVAYADFVTAMMALFIVLWIVGQDQEIKDAVSLYFREPHLPVEEIRLRLVEARLAAGDGGSEEATEGAVGPEILDLGWEPESQDDLESLARRLRLTLTGAGWKLGKQGSIVIRLTAEGLLVELIDVAPVPFFEVGSAEPTEPTRRVLKALASPLGAISNPLVVEGHTDARPFPSSAQYGNWELSTDRANAVRRLLVAYGIPESRFQAVRGYADRRPRVPEDPFSDRNRRISIVVLPPIPAGKDATGSGHSQPADEEGP